MSLAVQVAALSALSNLLVAAHPIMSRHAQKLLCECLAYLQRHSEHQLIRSLAVEVTTRAWVVVDAPATSKWKRLAALNKLLDPQFSELVRSIEENAEKYR